MNIPGSTNRLLALMVALLIPSSLAGQTTSTSKDETQHHQMMMMNVTDADFVPMAIKHHQDGIRMSQLVEQRGSSATIKSLAKKIRESQEREINELRAQASQATGTQSATSQERQSMDKMMEQQSQTSMKRLESSRGEVLDHAFLEEMSKHHRMAIQMGENAKLQDAELKQLAQKMVTAQRQELEELQKLHSTQAKAQ